MSHTTGSLLATLALCAACFHGCDKNPEAVVENEVVEAPQAAAFDADCTVTEGSRSLGVIVLRDQEQRCTVFVPEPAESGDFSIALRADPAERSVAAELVDEEGQRLYATDGEASIQASEGRMTGRVNARDQNSPAVGRLRILIDAPMP